MLAPFTSDAKWQGTDNWREDENMARQELGPLAPFAQEHFKKLTANTYYFNNHMDLKVFFH